MLPLWIAREEGYFARRGLEVELIWLHSTLSTTFPSRPPLLRHGGKRQAPNGSFSKLSFEGFVDHTLLKESRLQQEKNSR
jgi:hypothetical protein